MMPSKSLLSTSVLLLTIITLICLSSSSSSLVLGQSTGASSTNSSCPLGHICLNPSFTRFDEVRCVPSQYCPGGQRGTICSKGHYCPTPSQQLICPQGYFCPPASIEPRKCSVLASCPEGSERYFHWGALLLLLIILPVMAGGSWIYRKSSQKYHQHHQQQLQQLKQSAVELADLSPSSPSPSPSSQLIIESVPRMDIKFANLAAAIQVNGQEKMIVSDVSGHFKSGRLIAVMGPSGAGQ